MFLGDLVTHFHQVRGGLYAIDEKTFFIENFNYDGAGISEPFYSYNVYEGTAYSLTSQLACIISSFVTWSGNQMTKEKLQAGQQD